MHLNQGVESPGPLNQENKFKGSFLQIFEALLRIQRPGQAAIVHLETPERMPIASFSAFPPCFGDSIESRAGPVLELIGSGGNQFGGNHTARYYISRLSSIALNLRAAQRSTPSPSAAFNSAAFFDHSRCAELEK